MDFSLVQTIGGVAFVTLIIIEIIFSLKYDRELYEWKDLAASSSLGIGSALIAIFTKALTLAFFFAVYYRVSVYHLEEREFRAVFAADRSKGEVRYPCHRGKKYVRGEFVCADLDSFHKLFGEGGIRTPGPA